MPVKSSAPSRQSSALWIVLFIFLIAASFLVLQLSDDGHMFTLAAFVLSIIGLVRAIKARKTVKPAAKPSPEPPEVQFSFAEPLCDIENIQPAYAQRLDAIKANMTSVQRRRQAVDDLIDDTFDGSYISSQRYKQVMNSAHEILKENYENATQAARIFGESEPTSYRLAFLDKYVQDAQELVDNMDKVIDELVLLKQSSSISEGDVLDASLKELAATTGQYKQKKS